ncbi:disease resistance At4g27190-like [Olea europaea subsp. europaea]|uniref:Disease resistance At4g27190-like n=1 Tax=Olea europaea subsp. europaea TaxID=158383 RepID=A0A8S0SZ14_OLEEU|nr:disease resistance At4g27190-like [Olea europaea subsp. europaea]
MAVLKDKVVSIIGFCGMPGVGKTTVANEVANEVKVDEVFDDVAIAVVSQDPDIQIAFLSELELMFPSLDYLHIEECPVATKLGLKQLLSAPKLDKAQYRCERTTNLLILSVLLRMQEAQQENCLLVFGWTDGR